MSNISELANVPQISFIENMTLQETEEQLKAEYARIYREQTGKELVLGEADAKTLLLKAFALIEYQTMQYADIKGQAELLKTAGHVELEWLRNLVRMAADKDLCGAKFAPPLSMHQYETWARYNTEIGCLLGKYIASVKK